MDDIKQTDMTSLKKGSSVIIDGEPCRVTDLQVSRPGKHGHAKVRLSAVGLMDDKKRIIVKPGHDKIDVPIIGKKIAQVLSISGDKVNVMDSETFETLDLDIPAELKSEIVEGVNVLYWTMAGKKIIKQVK